MEKNQPWTRKTILSMEGVQVKVTPRGKYMVKKDRVSFDGVEIPERYQHGLSIQRGVIVYRNFYGITEDDLGQNITAKVEVKEKTLDGVTHLMMDITNTGGTATSRLVISPEGEGLRVLDTDTKIRFVERKGANRMQLA